MFTTTVALETDNICCLDNYFIFAIYDILEDKWHIFSFPADMVRIFTDHSPR